MSSISANQNTGSGGIMETMLSKVDNILSILQEHLVKKKEEEKPNENNEAEEKAKKEAEEKAKKEAEAEEKAKKEAEEKAKKEAEAEEKAKKEAEEKARKEAEEKAKKEAEEKAKKKAEEKAKEDNKKRYTDKDGNLVIETYSDYGLIEREVRNIKIEPYFDPYYKYYSSDNNITICRYIPESDNFLYQKETQTSIYGTNEVNNDYKMDYFNIENYSEVTGNITLVERLKDENSDGTIDSKEIYTFAEDGKEIVKLSIYRLDKDSGELVLVYEEQGINSGYYQEEINNYYNYGDPNYGYNAQPKNVKSIPKVEEKKTKSKGRVSIPSFMKD